MMKEIKSKLEFKAIFVMLRCYKSHPDKNIRESLVHTTLRKHVIQTGSFQIKGTTKDALCSHMVGLSVYSTPEISRFPHVEAATCSF